MQGYKEASKLDKQIAELLEKYPVEENGMEWWHLTRTVKSTLEILEEKAKDVLSADTRELIKKKTEQE